MRVGIFCSTGLGLKGPDVYLENLVEHLVEEKDVEVYLVHHQKSNHAIFRKAKEIIIPPLLGSLFLRKYRLDILHFNGTWGVLFFPFLKAKKVATIHGDIDWAIPTLAYNPHFSPLKRLLGLVSSKLCDAFIAVSYDLKERISHFLHIPKSKIYVTHLAPRDVFQPLKNPNDDYLKRKYSIIKPFILHVSYFGPKKNPETILKTFKLLINDGFDLQLVIAGARWNEQTIVKKLVARLGLSNYVKILGFVPLEDLAILFGSARVFFQPSFHENCPQTLLEAMACGTPVVTSKVFSIPEVTGNAGILHEPRDYVGFAKSIRNILTNENYRKKLQEIVLENVRRFSWEKTTRQTIDVYKRVLSQ